MRKNKKLSWLIAVIFIFTTMLGAVPSQAVAADLSDIGSHWAQSQIEDLITRGIVTGYPDNTFKPDNTISRAEFITMTNRAFSFTATSEINYTDVPANEWYAAEVAKAKAAGYIAGYEDGTMRPGAQITRQEVAKILSVILKLDSSSDSAVSGFTDAASIPAWSRGYVAAMVTAGYINGYPDGTFKASNAINRAEASVIMGRATGPVVPPVQQKAFDKAGTYGPASGTQTIDGNVTISADGVILQNTTIKGNLLITEAVGAGAVTLKNITVTGTTTFKGGGLNSIYIDNCKLGKVIADKANGNLRIVLSGTSKIAELVANYAVKVEGTGTIDKATIHANGVSIVTSLISKNNITVDSGKSMSYGTETISGTTSGGGSSGGNVTTAATVASGITSVTAPAVDAVTLTLPTVPTGYTIAINTSSEEGVIATNGTISSPLTATTVSLVFTITKTADNTQADTAAINVTVPARSETVITSLDEAGTYVGNYRLNNLTAPLILGPATGTAYITGTLYLDPGETYDLTLRNIVANNVEVLSGAANTITMVNVGVLTVLIIKDDTGVRIVTSDGTSIASTNIASSTQAGNGTVLEVGANTSMGSIGVSSSGEVTLKGDFGDSMVTISGDDADIKVDSAATVPNITVAGNATIEAETVGGQTANIGNIAVTGAQQLTVTGDMTNTTLAVTGANAGITLSDNAKVGTVAVSSSSTITTGASSTISNVNVDTANAVVTLTTGAGATVTNVGVSATNTDVSFAGTGDVGTVTVEVSAAGATLNVGANVVNLSVAANTSLTGDNAAAIDNVEVTEEAAQITATQAVITALSTPAETLATDKLVLLPADANTLTLAADYQNVVDAYGAVNALKALNANYDLTTLANYAKLAPAVTKMRQLVVANAKANLSMDTGTLVSQNIVLPTTVGTYGSIITWQSGTPALLGNNGKLVARPDADTQVTLTATITRGDQSDTEQFIFTVKAKETVADVVASLGSLAVSTSVTAGTAVVLKTTTSGATIRYTVDGSDPTPTSPVYSIPITISATTTIKAIALKDGMLNSGISIYAYTVSAAPALTGYAVNKGTVFASTSIILPSPTATGNVFKYAKQASAFTVPLDRALAPAGLKPYTSAADILSCVAGEHIGLYELNAYNRIVKFFDITLIQDNIKEADKTALTTAIDNATTLLNSKTVGTTVGNVPQTAKDTYSAAITAATTVKDMATATQAQVDAAVTTLATATTAFNAAVVPVGNKTALNTAITNAATLLSSKNVGTAVGNVPQTAKDTYSAAITAATTVKDSATVNQTEVDAAVATLATATTAFNATVIPVGNKTALTTAITNATTLLNSKNAGTAVGNVPQTAKDTYSAAITAATTVKNSSTVNQTEVDAAVATLATATTAFNAAVIPVGDKTALTTAIDNANALLGSKNVGTAVGNVPQAAHNAYNTAITAATTVKNSTTVNQTQVDAAVATLATATTAFNNAVIPVGNKTALNTAITDATALLNGKTVGTAVGNVTQAAHDAYSTAIAAATTVRDSETVNQTEVDAAATTLATATTAFNNAVIPGGNKTVLNAAITNATSLLNSKTAGTAVGNVPQTAKDAYSAAITTATGVKNSATASQVEVDAAVAALATATTAFNNAVIPVGDKAALTAAISSATSKATAAVAGTDPGQYPQAAIDALNSAITTAQAVANSAIVNQTEVDAAVTAMNTAVSTFDAAKIIAGVKLSELNGSALLIGNVAGGSDVTLVVWDFANVLSKINGISEAGLKDGSIKLAVKYGGIEYEFSYIVSLDEMQAAFATTTAILEADALNIPVYVKPADKEALTTAIADATALLNGKTVGAAVGNVPQAAYNAYNAAITAVTTVNSNAVATQAEVDAAVSALATATTAFNAAIIPVGNKTALNTAIADATTKKNGAVAGTEPGQYPQAAIDELTSAIATAQAVADSAIVTQTEVDAAVTALNTVVNTFDAAKIHASAKLSDLNGSALLIGNVAGGSDVTLVVWDFATVLSKLSGISEAGLKDGSIKLAVKYGGIEYVFSYIASLDEMQAAYATSTAILEADALNLIIYVK